MASRVWDHRFGRSGRSGGLGAIACGLAILVGVAASPAAAQIPLRAVYDDDFILESEDGAFQLRIRGNLHLDARFTQAEHLGAAQDLDLRRARIDLMGRLYRRFTFRIQTELSGSPYVRNAWADWELAPPLHVRWGQMKVPFSTSWLTQDNNLEFVERGTNSPVHPFFDRGLLVWGTLVDGAVAYDLGVFTGAGADVDASAGDPDSGKEWAARLFVQPFRNAGVRALRGVAVAVGGTWADESVPGARTETRGHRAADYGTALWRWRTEQVLGTDGRVTDRVAAELGTRRRLGGELHWVLGPVALSTELLEVRYGNVAIHHDLYVGSSRVVHEPVLARGGRIRSWSTWASWYVTGESEQVTDGGWRTARPARPVGEGGPGAIEVLARYSRTTADLPLFDAVTVAGYSAGDPALPASYGAALPGAGNALTAAVLDGAHAVNEATVGVGWTVNPMVRIQLNDVYLWAPSVDRDGDGANDNTLLSGAFTAQSDPGLKYRRTAWANAIILRLALKL